MVERRTLDAMVAGSIPAEGINLPSSAVERRTFDAMVAGSIPAEGIVF